MLFHSMKSKRMRLHKEDVCESRDAWNLLQCCCGATGFHRSGRFFSDFLWSQQHRQIWQEYKNASFDFGVVDKVKVPDVPEGDYVLSWRWEPCFTAQAVQGDGGDGHVMKYHLVMTNSSPWKVTMLFFGGKRSISMGHQKTMASPVSHNQMVIWWRMSVAQKHWPPRKRSKIAIRDDGRWPTMPDHGILSWYSWSPWSPWSPWIL